MADDGMLMNFDLGEAAAISVKPKWKGGSWRDRSAAKRSTNGTKRNNRPADRAVFDKGSYGRSGPEEYIGTGPNLEKPAERPAKRIRTEETDGNDSYARTESQNFPKKKNTNSDTFDRNAATASVISGKLPAGSIDFNGKNKKVMKFDDFDNDDIAAGKLPSTNANTNAGHKQPKDTLGTPGGKQVISSLFRFNPAAKTTFEDTATDEDAKPSNAPLSDEASTFANLGLSRRLASHLATKLELKAPTGIQKAAVPQMIKEDSDAFIQAQTGSGKTLAYLLPIVERILSMSGKGEAAGTGTIAEEKVHRKSGLFAVVLAPTRELCKQISVVLEKLLRCAPWIVSTTVIGGESKQSEKARLRKGVNILIATPGRMADHLDNTEALDVSNVRWLVMDEGDRLMELGFEEEIRGIVEKIGRRTLANGSSAGNKAVAALPSRRVTVLCSATMKMNVQRLGEISLVDAVHIKADPSDEPEKNTEDGAATEDKFSAPSQLKQSYAVVPAKLRLVTLYSVLKRTFARRGSVMKAIVFISCADSVDFHFNLFSRDPDVEKAEEASKDVSKEVTKGASKANSKTASKAASPPPSASTKADLTKDTTAPCPLLSSPENRITISRLHGSLAQNIRTATLKAFSESKDPSILICTDVAARGLDVSNVDYVLEYDPPFSSADHLHRIGRTARAGRAGQSMIFLMPGCEEGYISSVLQTHSKSLSGSTGDELIRKGFGGTGKEWEDRATEWQLDVERWVLESPKELEMARRAFQSHVRAYATHVSEERKYFDIKELHLGHLAKAFGLRDRPGAIKVPGLRPGKGEGKKEKGAAMKRKRGKKEEEVVERAPEGERAVKERKARLDNPVVVDEDEARKRMRRKMMEHMSAASEFNIG